MKLLGRKRVRLAILLLIPIVIFWYSLPEKIFDAPYSTVVRASDGRLLGARVAKDGQWRFPPSDSIPKRIIECVVTFEDRHFYRHPGVNPVSLIRAFKQNRKSGKVVSGGSTITMQVARLSMHHSERNITNKILEIVRAMRIEYSYSKNDIMALWLNHAPFGGNVVGIEAASWRYFNRPAAELSWAESATLAVLPNAPSLIYIGKNQRLLINKRNRLLLSLLQNNKIDSLTYQLSIAENLPEKVYNIPSQAYHLTDYMNFIKGGEASRTTIDYEIQTETERIIQPLVEQLSGVGIGNAAILILDVKTGNVIAYHGNMTSKMKQTESNYFVDVIRSVRSSGSILKPFLYAGLYDQGKILPQSLVSDIPSFFGDYQPENFDKKYCGVVSSGHALASSLNVPAVRLLKEYGVANFHRLLNDAGLFSINRGADYYGLSLVLGGAEVSLWEITSAYASMARVLQNYHTKGYRLDDWHLPKLFNDEIERQANDNGEILSASAIYQTLTSLLDANRPHHESGWRLFSSTKKIAWKTGTSFGLKDAWSIGVNAKYAVGVWVGNADGEGRPNLTGLGVAAPIMFKIFNYLPEDLWFAAPAEEMIELKICKQTGYLAGPFCNESESVLADKNAESLKICPYHKIIHLTSNLKYQVNSSCFPVNQIMHENWLVLPPVEEYYYALTNPDYQSPPPFHPDCQGDQSQIIEFIYPLEGAKIYITKDYDGNESEVIFKVAHHTANSFLHWHLNNNFIGSTSGKNEMLISPPPGKNILTVLDPFGNAKSIHFTVLNRN